MTQRLRSITLTLSLLCINAAFAHHDAANHATEGKPIRWQGTVAFVSWDGAHVMYRIGITDANGVTVNWEVLGGSPHRLEGRGIYQKTVNAGEKVTVAGYLNLHNRIITPVYFETSDRQKLFVGYAKDDAELYPPTN